MATVIGIVVLVALFIAFPLVTRERSGRGCATGGCWKKRVGIRCGACEWTRGDEQPG